MESHAQKQKARDVLFKNMIKSALKINVSTREELYNKWRIISKLANGMLDKLEEEQHGGRNQEQTAQEIAEECYREEGFIYKDERPLGILPSDGASGDTSS